MFRCAIGTSLAGNTTDFMGTAMRSDFLFSGLEENEFSKYFNMSARELEELGAYIFVADECPCYPCRVSLIDAKVGESVLAISYEHHPEKSPYRSSGPIFVRQTAVNAQIIKNEIPEILLHRVLSVRAYNSENIMIGADVVEGGELKPILDHWFENNLVQYIHVHNAGPGCFNCSVKRA